jgi:hypothetical protein
MLVVGNSWPMMGVEEVGDTGIGLVDYFGCNTYAVAQCTALLCTFRCVLEITRFTEAALMVACPTFSKTGAGKTRG